jgi:uncharacterized protein with FMN-binding domain
MNDHLPLSQLVRKNLLALGSAAVLTVYSAGYVKTREAAAKFDGEDAERRPAPPVAQRPSNREALPPLAAAARPRAQQQPQPHRGAAESAEVRGGKAVGTATAPSSASESGLPAMVAVAGTAAPKSADSLVTPASTPVTTPVDSVALRVARSHAKDVADSIAQAAVDSAQAQRERERPYFKDGTYTGWGTSRHGDIQATVQVANGRITAAWVSQCLTQYSCSWIAGLPPQVVSRQSADVDYVSGATQSTNAFYQAVYQALTRAQ